MAPHGRLSAPTRRAKEGEPVRVLVEGRPGSGKSTAAKRLMVLVRDAGIPLGGFSTEEIREGRRRVGFAVETASGERGILAHVELPGPPKVSKYGVDLEAFEDLALPALSNPHRRGVVVVDELGKMELASHAFREAVGELFRSDVAVVATVHLFRHPFTDGLKRRPDIEVIRITRANRDDLPARLLERLLER